MPVSPISLWLPCLVLGASLAAPAAALAAGEPCFRDTECPGASLCLESVCGEDDPTLASCVDAGECGFDSECSSGFCKQTGIVCRNPAGACWVESDSGMCECGDGQGAGWSDGFNPDDPPPELTDEEIQLSCMDSLVENCGDQAPFLPESCQGAVLTDCEAFVAKSDEFAAVCGENVPEGNIARIGECCDRYNEPGFAEARACVLAIEVTTCALEEVEACFGGGDGGTPEDDNAGGVSGGDESEDDGAPEAADGDDDTSKAGCRVGGGSPVWTLMLLPFVALLNRRRRSA